MNGTDVNITSIAPTAWADLVAADPHADFFHTAIWTEALCRHLPHLEPMWLAVHDAGRLVAGLAAVRSRRRLGPLGEISRIESHFKGTAGGPVMAGDLTSEQRAKTCGALLSALCAQASGPLVSIAVALNQEQDRDLGHMLGKDGTWQRRDNSTAAICLQEGLEHVEMFQMAKNKRNERNRGLKRGAIVRVSREPAHVTGFHGLYSSACAVWGQAPVPLPLLQELVDDPAGGAFLACVLVEGQVIGGHLNLHHGDRVVAWLGATDPAWARSHFPATVAIWGDLIEACARGALWLDLGGSGGIKSLSGFKKYLGAEVQQRGFYLHESVAVRWLRRGRDWLRDHKAGRSAPKRVHDQSPQRKSGS